MESVPPNYGFSAFSLWFAPSSGTRSPKKKPRGMAIVIFLPFLNSGNYHYILMHEFIIIHLKTWTDRRRYVETY